MKTKTELNRLKAELAEMILASNYRGSNYQTAMTEYHILCWVLDVKPTDLDKIKNDAIIASLCTSKTRKEKRK